MGTITSGIGLISGLDFGSIVNQLIAIEARPRNSLLLRIGALNAQRTALLDISARILGMQSRISSLTDPLFFRSVNSTSSDPNVLTVSAGIDAQIGSYRFTVRNLASSHQMVSGGFRTRDTILPRGSMMIESAAARANNATTLDELNGYDGVQRGKFKIVDGDDETFGTPAPGAASTVTATAVLSTFLSLALLANPIPANGFGRHGALGKCQHSTDDGQYEAATHSR